MKLVYVAGKFRGPTAWAIEKNVRRAEEVGIMVAEAGAAPLIPHANTRNFHGTLTDDFWLSATMVMLERCDAVIMVPGWPDSQGALEERERAIFLGLPVFHGIAELSDWLRTADPTGTPTGGLGT